jgi:hypothetical protein
MDSERAERGWNIEEVWMGMNFKNGDHLEFAAVRRRFKDKEWLSEADRELIIKALDNTIEEAYWSTGGCR